MGDAELRRAKLLRELAELAAESASEEVRRRAELLRRIADVYERRLKEKGRREVRS